MTELKTFKDFMYDEWMYKDGTLPLSRSTRHWHISANNNLKRMRKEVIKWIKHMYEYMDKDSCPDYDNECPMHEIVSCSVEYSDCSIIIDWLMHFFNITEEDLK